MINSTPRRRRAAAPSSRRPGPRGARGGGDTRTRILDAAERLLAERGLDATSVRSILAEAGVNPALAHYHFGSREGLLAELLRTRIAPVVEEIDRALDAVEARGAAATLEDVLRAYFTPAVRWMLARPHLGALFAQLLASRERTLRERGREPVRPVVTRLAELAAARAPPRLDPGRLVLRLFLVVGGASHLIGNWESVVRAARQRLGADAAFDAGVVVEELVAFAAAGLRARGASGGSGR